MVSRNTVIEYLTSEYHKTPEFLWKKFPSYAIFRHNNGKWFAAIMQVDPKAFKLTGDQNIDIINLKIDPELGNILKQKAGYYSGYHMNKEHWLSIVLDEHTNFEELKTLIQDSYLMTSK